MLSALSRVPSRRLRSATRSMATWDRLVRFVPADDSSKVLVGEPKDKAVDVGLATFQGDKVEVDVYEDERGRSGSILSPSLRKNGQTATVGRLLSPLSEDEVGTIRCIGLNYKLHAKETGLPLPTVPILFQKPSTCLTGPHPSEVIVPKFTIPHDTADYESELGVIIGKDCKDVSEADAMNYVLGYTATNDVSSRHSQFEQSQWCFSKSFDTACPAGNYVGPAVVSTRAVPDPSKLHMKGIKNGKTMQETGLDDLVFGVAKLVSFLSQGTTMKAGTLILTGTPHGIGAYYKPTEFFKDGDLFTVEISGGIGSLVNRIVFEK